MYESLKLIRQRLSSEGTIDVIYGGHSWKAGFEWFKQASAHDIASLKERLNVKLPEDYERFLTDVSNGLLLFYDIQYGQWGYKLYGTEELIERGAFWEENLIRGRSSQFLAFGETIGDSHALLFDLHKPSGNRESCAVIEGNVYDPISNCPATSRSFHEWLDHLITAQGDKYWEWM